MIPYALYGLGLESDELTCLQVDNSDDDEPPDEVRLWEDGFKDRYYESKFDVGPGGMKPNFKKFVL